MIGIFYRLFLSHIPIIIYMTHFRCRANLETQHNTHIVIFCNLATPSNSTHRNSSRWRKGLGWVWFSHLQKICQPPSCHCRVGRCGSTSISRSRAVMQKKLFMCKQFLMSYYKFLVHKQLLGNYSLMLL